MTPTPSPISGVAILKHAWRDSNKGRLRLSQSLNARTSLSAPAIHTDVLVSSLRWKVIFSENSSQQQPNAVFFCPFPPSDCVSLLFGTWQGVFTEKYHFLFHKMFYNLCMYYCRVYRIIQLNYYASDENKPKHYSFS